MRMNTLDDAQAHVDELRRQADQAHLIHETRHHQDSGSLFQLGRDILGRTLIALGSRLSHQPICQPVEAATVNDSHSTGNAVLVLSECC